MAAELLLKERRQLSADAFVELRVWRVPQPLRGSMHDLKYAMAYIVGGACVLRYDNESGKGITAILGPSRRRTISQPRSGCWRTSGTT